METNKESQMQICNDYLKSMTAKELKAYEIAKSHLGDSFQLEKSIGFIDWMKKNSQVK